MVNFLPDDKRADERVEREAVARAKNQISSDMATPNALSAPTQPNFAELSRLADSPAKSQQPSAVSHQQSEPNKKIIEPPKSVKSIEPPAKPIAGPDITVKKPALFDAVKNIFKKKNATAPTLAPDNKDEALNVNLLPEQFQQASEVKEKLTFLMALVGSAIILMVAGWGAFSLLTKAKVAERAQYEGQIKIENQAVSDLKKQIQESSSKGRQVLAVQQILSARRNYLAFLAELEKQTMSVVSFDALSLSDTYNLSLMAKAPTLEDATKQYNIFKNSPILFISAAVTQFSAKEKTGADSKGDVSFPITLTINKDIFAKSMLPYLNTMVAPVSTTPEPTMPATAETTPAPTTTQPSNTGQ